MYLTLDLYNPKKIKIGIDIKAINEKVLTESKILNKLVFKYPTIIFDVKIIKKSLKIINIVLWDLSRFANFLIITSYAISK